MSNVEADLAIGMMGWTEIDGKWYCCEDGCPIFDSYFDCNGCGDVFPVADKRYEDGDETGDPFCTKCVD